MSLTKSSTRPSQTPGSAEAGRTWPTKSFLGAMPGSAGCPGGALLGLAKCTTRGFLWPPVSRHSCPSSASAAASAWDQRWNSTIAQPLALPSLPFNKCRFLTVPNGVNSGQRSSSRTSLGTFARHVERKSITISYALLLSHRPSSSISTTDKCTLSHLEG